MDVRNGLREGLDKAIKQYIYTRKEEIIDRVVERAAREMVKKGMVKFLDQKEEQQS